MSNFSALSIEQQCVNVVRGLTMDAPHLAKSGHQGTAMALAPLAHVLFGRVMKYDPTDPAWPDRDRFVLSAGHASILQYAMLALCGFGLSLDDLRAFRQLDSLTPGHPEYGHTAGVEVTTGPLGQGIANAVGMALATAHLRERVGADLVDHTVWCIAGDGCLSEGISHEAASLAGHLKLSDLVVIYDDNRITIDGSTDLALSDDASLRFRSYGWHVIEAGEIGEDLDALESVLREAQRVSDAPVFVRLQTHIGFPSPGLTDHHSAHGLAFDEAEIAATKQVMSMPDEPFWVPEEVASWYHRAAMRGTRVHEDWNRRVAAAPQEIRDQWEALSVRDTTVVDASLPDFEQGSSVATRVALSTVLSSVAQAAPDLIAGGADLTSNTGVAVKGFSPFRADNRAGRQVFYGVREHAMGAVMNGLALHGQCYPVGGTFLVFSDYMRPSVRLAALMQLPVLYSWSHDSVGVGEDGPTHQPVEQLASLRAIPGLDVVRPADANETAWAVAEAYSSGRPTALILSRQNLPVLENTHREGFRHGAYVLREEADCDVTLVATGSEVSLALRAADVLNEEDILVQVVSMPSWLRFAESDESYRESVIPSEIPAVSIEAGSTLGWERWVDACVGIDRFGTSAPGDLALDVLGINLQQVLDTVHATLALPT